jgi:hypothetical protein
MRKVTLSLALALSATLILAVSVVHAATPYQGSNAEITEEQLATTEQKLLQKTYAGDPLPKRLQRLELSLFGATQYGSNNQRWHNIKSYLSNADTSKKNISSSLNELEKYIFKKTTPAESASLRLNKLETKLFGKPSPSMPIAYRISRLKRTLGLAAGPDGMAELPNNLPPSFRGMPGMELAPGMPVPGFGNNFGFEGGDRNDPNFDQFESQISQLFRQMEQMQQMQQMQPHGFEQPHDSEQAPGYDEHHFYMYSTPDGGFKWGTESNPNFNPGSPQQKSKKLKPDNSIPNSGKAPALPAPHLIPQPNIPEDHIPSYSDPNFI